MLKLIDMLNKNMQVERFKLKNVELQQLEKIYEVAQKVHEEKPYDAAHDWEHHFAVCKNGLEIIYKENLQDKIDMPVFFAASLFHDLERGSKGHELAVLKMKEVGFDDKFVNKMVDLINEHSFADKQESLAGTVLWAADKIEYVSKDRFIHSLANLSLAKRIFYKNLWRSRIEDVSKKFENIGLPSANQIFKTKFKELKDYVDNEEPSYRSWFNGLKLSMI